MFIPLYLIPFLNSSTRKSNAWDKVGGGGEGGGVNNQFVGYHKMYPLRNVR